ncbi:hypothetical protein LEP1GSC047_3376 [Leptospira inadai serovar Lyme str. 10]|uniref:Bacterial group 3 Ig-like protein n=2 Tax=Leptospira inadai serovar Lyme TaxID=293084 RepID=V6HTY8_9LEPT|nr:hypothetical protein [Leptospira inadai]EQA36199.1 hypothetical protein LEP1GSC047_3376 [Leptospira inadai serovar Lyme str. 10]PNV74850.1 hypothetical protein BES34_011285 [Leptospira inadai serovar Lyme]
MTGAPPIRLIAICLLIVSTAASAQNTEDDEPERQTTPKSQTQPSTKSSGGSTKNAPKSEGGTSGKKADADEKAGTTPDVYVNSKIKFELTSSDDASKVDFVEYRIGEEEYVTYTAPIFIAKEGLVKVSYRGVDKVGNKENPKTLLVLVDNTPPTLKINPSQTVFSARDQSYAPKETTYTIAATDNLAGVKEVKFSVNGGEFKTYDNQPIRLDKLGVNTLKYFATDKSNNTSQEGIYVVTVDFEKPTVLIAETIPLVAVESKLYTKKGNSFSLKGNDTFSGIKQLLVKLDGATEWAVYKDAFTVTAQGQHSIEAKSVDNVGNESEVQKLTFILDLTPPETKIRQVDTKSESANPSNAKPAGK